MDHKNHITQLIKCSQKGDEEAHTQLISLLYQELKTMASMQKAKFNQQTFNTTAIVHEAWIKLNNSQLEVKDRQHYLATASLAIRQLLINAIKKKQRQKRNSAKTNTLFSELHGQNDPMFWLIELDEMLNLLEQKNPRLAQVFQMRYFTGLNFQDIAEVLNVTTKTIHRDWIKAKYALAAYML